jgi:hypothetical protein
VTLYAYKAMDARGRIILGRMDAINDVDLELRLKRMELDYINGSPLRQGLLVGQKVARRELINFCFHLEQLTRAGVSILDGLTDLRDSLESPRFREVIAGLIESIDGGKTLSQAMAEHPQVFDGVFVSLVRAGDRDAEFAPVKNADGPDSPETARALMTRLYSSWVRQAGGRVTLPPGAHLEISPLFALDAGELAARLPAGFAVSGPTYLR